MIQFLFEQGFISSRGKKKDLNIEGFMTGIIDLAFRKGVNTTCLIINQTSLVLTRAVMIRKAYRSQ